MSISQAISIPSSTAIVLPGIAKEFSDPPAETVKGPSLKDGMWRLLNATVSLLNHTHAELDMARKSITELESKIAQLETQASTDILTGLKNRRGFDEAMAQEFDRTNRGLSCGGVLVLLDLDNFKAINDTYSHLAGDACLKLVANTLDAQIRIMDTAARLGGDEYVIMLTNTTREQVLERIQTMVWQLNNLSLIWDGIEIPVRASVGVTEYRAGDTPESVYHAADISMYEEKAISRMSR